MPIWSFLVSFGGDTEPDDNLRTKGSNISVSAQHYGYSICGGQSQTKHLPFPGSQTQPVLHGAILPLAPAFHGVILPLAHTHKPAPLIARNVEVLRVKWDPRKTATA